MKRHGNTKHMVQKKRGKNVTLSLCGNFKPEDNAVFGGWGDLSHNLSIHV